MRVTNKMMIDNTKYWISKQAEKLNEVETTSASGKQVNKPSDDPEAAAKILEYRAAIAKYSQYNSNTTEADTWIEMSEETLDSVDSFLDQVSTIADSYTSADSDAQKSYIETLANIYTQIMNLANTKCSSDYMYAGNELDSKPFSNEISLSSGNVDIGYYLTSDASNVTLTIYNSSGSQAGTHTISGGGISGSNTISWDGSLDDGTTLSDGDYTFTVSASGSFANPVAASCYQGDNSGSKTIIYGEGSTAALNCNGGEIFSEALSAITRLTISLESGTTADVSAATASLTAAKSKIKSERIALSNVYSQLEISSDRLDKLSELVKEKLSTVETGDTNKAAVELSAQETAYETTVSVASKILNLPKLSDYI
jgi:flagellar hook-associated protein 3